MSSAKRLMHKMCHWYSLHWCLPILFPSLSSGTTGKPKGVELLHSNQVSNIKAGREMVDDPADYLCAQDRSLAFLPWAHSYGQVRTVACSALQYTYI